MELTKQKLLNTEKQMWICGACENSQLIYCVEIYI